MEDNSKSIIDKINKEYSFSHKFIEKIKTKFDLLLTGIMFFILYFIYPGIKRFGDLFILFIKIFDIKINKENLNFYANMFAFFVLVFCVVFIHLILKFLNFVILKIVVKKNTKYNTRANGI